MLESLQADEFDRFAAALREHVANTAPFYMGYTVRGILVNIVETPNEFSADEWTEYLLNVGYNHDTQRYYTDELIPALVASMASGPNSTDQDRYRLLDRIICYRFMEDCPDWVDNFPGGVVEAVEAHWTETCNTFGYRFRDNGSMIPQEDES